MELVKDTPETTETKPTPSIEDQITATEQIINILKNKREVHKTELSWLSLQQTKSGRFIVIVNDLHTAYLEGKEQIIKLADRTTVTPVSMSQAKQLCKLRVFSHKQGGKGFPARGFMPFRQFHETELNNCEIAIPEYERQLLSLQKQQGND